MLIHINGIYEHFIGIYNAHMCVCLLFNLFSLCTFLFLFCLEIEKENSCHVNFYILIGK